MQYRLLVSAITLGTVSAVAIPQREVIAPNGERQIQATASVSNEHVQAQYTSIPITVPNGPGKLHIHGPNHPIPMDMRLTRTAAVTYNYQSQNGPNDPNFSYSITSDGERHHKDKHHEPKPNEKTRDGRRAVNLDQIQKHPKNPRQEAGEDVNDGEQDQEDRKSVV